MRKKLKWTALVVILFITITSFAPAAQVQAEETIILNDETGIADTNLYRCILDAADKNADAKLQLSEAEALTGLYAEYKGIKSLAGIDYCKNLSTLNLTGNEISDISPISKLTKMWFLSLGSNKISDLSPLAELTGIVSLHMDENEITDITPLANLTKLQFLTMSYNKITDISVLSRMQELDGLIIRYNQISDISALSNTTELRVFEARNNQISDITPLAKNTEMTSLELGGNVGITDISAIENMKHLSNLVLDDIQINDFRYLEDKREMYSLSLFSTGLTDISFLANMPKLGHLQLGYDDIGGDIRVLSKLTKLEVVNLPGLDITDISPLKGLTELYDVGLARNQISDISVLENLQELRVVNLNNNYISDFSVLDRLSNLEEVSKENNIPAPENGWLEKNNANYWYENYKRQGTSSDPKGVVGDGTVRGREIYDPVSDGWYWLDAVYDGAKAVNKEVWMPYIYQNEADWPQEEVRMNAQASGDMAEQVIREINNRTGKWVRYDENGKMYKGWYTVEGAQAVIYPDQVGNTYYYDHRTGLMAKGEVEIDGVVYYFDTITGVLQK